MVVDQPEGDDRGPVRVDRSGVQPGSRAFQERRERAQIDTAEFALMLPFTGASAETRVAALRDALANQTSCEAASVGSATVQPGGSVADAVREADAAMYAAKRSRRAAQGKLS